jgi:hypothetical protein
MLTWLVSTAPGEPEWIYDPPSAKADQVRFLGCDGSTWLTGRFHRPIMSTGQDVDVEDPQKTPSVSHYRSRTRTWFVPRKQMEPFDEAFTPAGFSAFTFVDYATFGASEGLPRHQVHPNRHVADFQAAFPPC